MSSTATRQSGRGHLSPAAEPGETLTLNGRPGPASESEVLVLVASGLASRPFPRLRASRPPSLLHVCWTRSTRPRATCHVRAAGGADTYQTCLSLQSKGSSEPHDETVTHAAHPWFTDNKAETSRFN